MSLFVLIFFSFFNVSRLEPTYHLFSWLAGAIAKRSKKDKDIERIAATLYWEHLMYNNFLRDLPHIPLFAEGGYGEDQGYRYVIEQRLGRNLLEVIDIGVLKTCLTFTEKA